MATKKYNRQNFNYSGNDGFTVEFTAYTTDTRHGFCHTVQTYWYDGSDYGMPTDTKTSYYNRTWEAFDYQTTLARAIDKLPAKQRAAVHSVIVDRKPMPEIQANIMTA